MSAKLPFSDMDHLEEALRATVEQEAALRGVPPEPVFAERQRQLARGCSQLWVLRKWRELNAISVAAYCRLTGEERVLVRGFLEVHLLTPILEPITGRVMIALRCALQSGFTYDEIERARAGEHVHLTKLIPPTGGIS